MQPDPKNEYLISEFLLYSQKFVINNNELAKRSVIADEGNSMPGRSDRGGGEAFLYSKKSVRDFLGLTDLHGVLMDFYLNQRKFCQRCTIFVGSEMPLRSNHKQRQSKRQKLL